MSTIRSYCGLLFVALLAVDCSSSPHIATVQLSVERFRELTAAKQFDHIYSEAPAVLKRATTAQAMTSMRQPPIVNSAFENGPALEAFVFVITGGEAF